MLSDSLEIIEVNIIRLLSFFFTWEKLICNLNKSKTSSAPNTLVSHYFKHIYI